MPPLLSRGKLAVVGDELFTLGFTLGGASLVFNINASRSDSEVISEIDRAFSAIYKEGATLVIIQDKLREIVQKSGHPRRVPPLVVYIPDLKTYKEVDVRRYYLSLIRRYLGISLELG